MAIQTTCPNCQTVYRLADHLAGRKVRCKNCGEAITVRPAGANADADRYEVESGSAASERERIQARPQASQRSMAPGEDKPARPRRRRQDYDEDEPPIRQGNRGLVIGLIAGGAALLLLFAGGILVAVLVIASRSASPVSSILGDDDSWPPAGPPNPPADSVILHISGIADESTREAVSDKLEALASNAQNHIFTSSSRGDRMTVFMMPVADVQTLAQKLDLGEVISVNGRTITIAARKVEGPPPGADAVARALYHLKSLNPNKRREAARTLKDTLPDQRRAEVVKALEPLVDDADHFSRHWAIEALGVWGNKDAVPILLKAMKNKDTRGDAMKALGRIKDERAAEPIAERLEEFFDRHEAEEALKQMGPVAEKAVLAHLNHHDWQVRTTVCDILGVIGTKQSLPPLEKVVAAGKDPASGQNHLVAMRAEQAIKAIKARQ